MDLDAEYRRRCAEPSDISMFLPRLVELVTETNAMHVIELGVRAGNSTVAFLYALQHTGGTLTSIDVSAAPDLGPQQRWRYMQGDDLGYEVRAFLDDTEADIVFIDTTHTYLQTLGELFAYRPLVGRGYLVLHDTELVIDGIQPVKAAMSEFCGHTGFTWTNDHRYPGLGEIRVA